MDSYNELSHLIGTKNEKITLVPSFDNGFEKDSRRRMSEREKSSLIEENMGTIAHNFAGKSDITGTHYEKNTASEIAQMIMPLKGL